MTSFEHAERRVLAALWIDHHGPQRALDPDNLRVDYGIDLTPQTLNAIGARLKARGIAAVIGDNTSVGMILKPIGFPEAQAAALSLIGGSTIMVNFAQKEVIGDGEFGDDFPGSSGWKYMTAKSSPSQRRHIKPHSPVSLTAVESKLLTTTYAITNGDTRQTIEARAVMKRFNFGDQTSGWVIDATKELRSLGLLAITPRDGADEDQLLQLTQVGVERALAALESATSAAMIIALDHNDPEYQIIAAEMVEIEAKIVSDNRLENKETEIARIRLVRALWDQASIRVEDLKIGVLLAVDDLCERTSSAYYNSALLLLASAITNFARTKLGIG
ncbi:hypothetical protein QH494_24825 [Sphingomonas sp. AR_OL41]|uniref:hypothetical protein n=1 Tax=Sphingomonas sp. AR_OL41 TaxID=3042729 RepID=UPI002480C346|nr:hypothetical protein [Sphingomonas sp. AR_OL41]MDH7975424.1 hypothetical protein [Sphingomonas sp. AR_OL41]